MACALVLVHVSLKGFTMKIVNLDHSIFFSINIGYRSTSIFYFNYLKIYLDSLLQKKNKVGVLLDSNNPEFFADPLDQSFYKGYCYTVLNRI